jgi:hypothetical protein
VFADKNGNAAPNSPGFLLSWIRVAVRGRVLKDGEIVLSNIEEAARATVEEITHSLRRPGLRRGHRPALPDPGGDRPPGGGERRAHRRSLLAAAGHLTLVPQLIAELARLGREDIMIVVGGGDPAAGPRSPLRRRRERHLRPRHGGRPGRGGPADPAGGAAGVRRRDGGLRTYPSELHPVDQDRSDIFDRSTLL